MIKIGLLTGSSLEEYKLRALRQIIEDDAYLIEVAIIDNKPRLTLKQKIKKNIKRGRGGYILIMGLKKIFSKKKEAISTIEYCKKNNINTFNTSNLYSNNSVQKLKEYELDVLILLGGFGIIKNPILNMATYGVLSYHHGNMRKYRGMPPALWELYNNENEMGITVQVLRAGLDKGYPIEEKTIKILKKDNLNTLQNRARDESSDMLYKALSKLISTNYKPKELDFYGKIYTLPNFRQWTLLIIKLYWRRLK